MSRSSTVARRAHFAVALSALALAFAACDDGGTTYIYVYPDAETAADTNAVLDVSADDVDTETDTETEPDEEVIVITKGDASTDAEADAEDTSPDASDVPGDTGPADVPGDATTPDTADTSDMGGLEDLLCIFDGSGSQAFGEDCGCANDCNDGESDTCARDLTVDLTGPSYCTVTCQSDFNCPEGYGCLSELGLIPGVDPFCRECASPTSGALGPGDACICDRDCGLDNSSGFPRTMGCHEGACAVTPCNDSFLPCPTGSQCQSNLEFPLGVCIECTHPTPQAEGASCTCESDCNSGLDCLADQCRQACSTDADCGAGRECREQVSGDRWCENVSALCQNSGAGTLGTPCACNGDCDPSAPVCLNQNVAGFDVAFCTQRPCSRTDPNACTGAAFGDYSCCEIPLVFPATCLPDLLSSQLGAVALCGP